MYVYMYMHIYIYIHMFVSLSLSIYIYIYIHVHILYVTSPSGWSNHTAEARINVETKVRNHSFFFDPLGTLYL